MDTEEFDESLWNQYMCADSEFFVKSKNSTAKPQASAFAFADLRGGLPVFGRQIGDKNWGYLAQSWETFFNVYGGMNSEDRTFFELVRPGVPINAYFDSELVRATNPGFEVGSELEKKIIEEAKRVILEGIHSCFPQVKEEEIELHELDASNAKKISRHFHIRIKGKALADFETAGMLYDEIVSRLPADSILNVVDPKAVGKACFLDPSVYTKNRQFRIYQSRKFGDYRFLSSPLHDKPGDKPQIEILKKTLITYFAPAEKKKLILLYLKSEVARKRKQAKRAPTKERIKKDRSEDSSHWLAIELATIFDSPPYKKTMEEDGTIIHYLLDTKKCEHFGGEHGSNHIIATVDLNSKTYRMSCFSTHCKGKISPPKSIPEKYHEKINTYMNTERDKIHLKSIFD